MNRRVTAIRERRFGSVRQAALAGGVSNTTWARYEESGNLTHGMRVAIAQAFGFEEDWPENPPAELRPALVPYSGFTPPGDGEYEELRELRRQTLAMVTDQALLIEDLKQDVQRLRDEVAELKRRPPESGRG